AKECNAPASRRLHPSLSRPARTHLPQSCVADPTPGGDASIGRMPPLTRLQIIDAPLPYVAQLEARSPAQVDLAVIHCTELPDLASGRAWGERVLYPSGTGNSGHYYIDRDGTVLRYVPDERIAHHVRGHNARAIGIELVNTGRYPHWLDSRQQAMD